MSVHHRPLKIVSISLMPLLKNAGISKIIMISNSHRSVSLLCILLKNEIVFEVEQVIFVQKLRYVHIYIFT